MISEKYLKRHSDEIKHRETVEWPFENWVVSEWMIPWNLREYVKILQSYLIDGGHGKHILDCGCGYGMLSIFLAKSGAVVKAFDVSPNCVSIARRLARENGVESSIEVSEGTMENLVYPDETFDVVAGTRVLHHVAIEPAVQEIVRVLKPGGLAIFWEPTYKNPLLRAMRKIYRALPGMPRRGTTFEHPLSRQEIAILQDAFEGRLRMHAGPFVFFSHVALVTGLRKWKLFKETTNAIDRIIDRALPFLRKWSYHQILVLAKESTNFETL